MSSPDLEVKGTKASSSSMEDVCKKGNMSGDVISHIENEEEDRVKVLFCQMDVLRTYAGDFVWKEMARWVKFEEALEEGGKRWSKPHVSSLSMAAFKELKQFLSTCPILLDVECNGMADVADRALESWIRDGDVICLIRNHIRGVLLKSHKHPHARSNPSYKDVRRKMKSIPDETVIKKSYSFTENGINNDGFELNDLNRLEMTCHLKSSASTPSLSLIHKTNSRFLRKIPSGTEVANLMVGEVEELSKRIGVFVRLKEAKNLGNITEVNLCTRFLFVCLGPKNQLASCVATTRCMGALLTDEVFSSMAYKAKCRRDILAGMEEFSNHMTVLPPGSWDPQTRIEPPDHIPSQEHRKNPSPSSNDRVVKETTDIHTAHEGPTLQRTGRLFGGLVDDVKRKIPWYKSDFTDALHIQCVASFMYLFLATLTPNVTFGGLLGDATNQYMGTMECILAAAITGVIYALFSGQPLNILGSTGPMLVLEGILYRFCKDNDWEFMPLRLLIGLWTTLFLMLIVAFDLSCLVRFITRFTEECFACLIAIIFIYEAFAKVAEIQYIAPVHFHRPENPSPCVCVMPLIANASNENITRDTDAFMIPITHDETTVAEIFRNLTTTTILSNIGVDSCNALGGTSLGDDCVASSINYVPDVFFFSWLLFLGTFTLAMALQKFRNSLFFPTFIRQNVSDFAVLIAIVAMVGLDAVAGIRTPKLSVPTEFKPTRPDRGWIINPISDKNPWWLYLFSAIPALLATILIFMDQHITAVIINRKENKLMKGSGYHLDMLIVAILVAVLSLLGLPWYVASTVTALAHVMSLKKESECNAPGEKPIFLGVREQRVTTLLVGIFSGLAVLFTSILQYIPMPVLYGVFLYMGVAALGGMQLVQRVLLVFMPQKYQPDHVYLRHVPLRRVHLYTAIQVLCLVLLWVVKSVKVISIAFPTFVLAIIFVRKGLDKVFTQRELTWLDEILPPFRTTSKKEKDKEKGVGDNEGDCRVPTSLQLILSPLKEKEVRRKHALYNRYSCPFICRTDLDAIVNASKLIDHQGNTLSAPKIDRKISAPVPPTFYVEKEKNEGNILNVMNFKTE
ncbi:hypothetical protein CHS0354_014104 [Potamilus streckersoni]|uniref:Anion exchange protein n=1 Tax=Potamilus streckersoni TaxID=2493646 RepID=A0AAE0TK17_9BIVA|nr:hypothetical protein CHS0354_014104 [Potamilus streckersoni]